MVIELSEELEEKVKARAATRGMAAKALVRELVAVGAGPVVDAARVRQAVKPLKSGRGMCAKYGITLTEEDIDENRRDMFRNFGEDF
jgi:hypothetical protein